MREDKIDLVGFLTDYPRMKIQPSASSSKVLRGVFEFIAEIANADPLCDSYTIQIEIPPAFPKTIPIVRELSYKIPRKGEFHVNDDGTLCLGSPLRLRMILSKYPTLVGFAEKCIVPYLFSVSLKLRHQGSFTLGELKHGEHGVILDYMDLFGLKDEWQVKRVLEYLGNKKRIANKRPCPCACGRRLGVCRFHYKLNEFRHLAPRSWFKAHYHNPGGVI